MDLLLIDGPNLAYRAHHAMSFLKTSDGRSSAAVYGFASILTRLLEDHKPKHFIVAWEGLQSTTWRKRLHPGYKAHRNAQPQEITEQLGALDELVTLVGGTSMALGGAEADDVIATLCRQGIEKGLQVGMVSSDKDLIALIRPGVLLLRPINAGGMQWWDYERVLKEYEIEPQKWQMRTALAGDPSDGIPGVKGIGQVTALKLVKEWGDLENLYAHIDEIKPPRCKKLLEEGQQDAELSWQVAKMLDDLPLELDEIVKYHPGANPESLKDYVLDWELSSLTLKLDDEARRRTKSI